MALSSMTLLASMGASSVDPVEAVHGGRFREQPVVAGVREFGKPGAVEGGGQQEPCPW